MPLRNRVTPLSELVAFYWARSVPRLSQFPGFAEQFTRDGRAPAKGEVFANPNLARTLEQIAKGGRDAFYRGEIARAIDAYMKANGGFLSYEDLAAHRSEWVEPVSTTYRGYELWELPPNGQGIAALEILNLLEGYDLAGLGPRSPEYVHLFVEAKKLAFEDRARWIADPAFAEAPVRELISKEYAAERRAKIDPKHAAQRIDTGDPRHAQGDTVYLCAADERGQMVSLIQSNYRGMGSGMVPTGLGFVLQDRGELFDLEPGRPNTYAPGKRPFHTIIPAFVTKDGAPWLCFGVMGGATQPQGHVQILCNLIDFGLNLQEAGDAARWQHEGSTDYDHPRMQDGGYVELESGVPYATSRALVQRGHDVRAGNGGFGGYQAIMWDAKNRVYVGASESRKDGQASGY